MKAFPLFCLTLPITKGQDEFSNTKAIYSPKKTAIKLRKEFLKKINFLIICCHIQKRIRLFYRLACLGIRDLYKRLAKWISV